MWKDELKKKWYLHNAKMNDTDKILFGNDYMCFTTCENEVIEFIESLLKEQREICASELFNYLKDNSPTSVTMEETIENAPEPGVK